MPAHVVHNTTFQYIYIFIWGEYNEYYLVDFKARCAIWNDILWHDIWHVFFLFIFHRWFYYRADSMFAPSQWETALLCNDVSHWLGANIESALPYILNWYLRQRHGFDIIATTLRFVILPLIPPYVACNVYLCHASNHVISLMLPAAVADQQASIVLVCFEPTRTRFIINTILTISFWFGLNPFWYKDRFYDIGISPVIISRGYANCCIRNAFRKRPIYYNTWHQQS